MPSPAESYAEQIAAALRSRFGGIDNTASGGTKYWYTVTASLRVDELLASHLRPTFNNATQDVIVQVLPGNEFDKEDTSGTLMKRHEFFVLAAKLWAPNTQDPWSIEAPIKGTIQNRMIRDLETRLYEDVRLGLVGIGAGGVGVNNTEIQDINRNIVIEDQRVWVAVELRLIVTYDHDKAAP